MNSQVVKFVRADKIVPTKQELAAERAEERSYRRGFEHGYRKAIDDFYKLTKGGMSAITSRPSEAMNILHHFCDTQIRDWRLSMDGYTPPAFSTPPPWKDVRQSIFLRDDHRCVWCNSPDCLECDHIVPVSAGGLPIPTNLRTLCSRCHKAKEQIEKVLSRTGRGGFHSVVEHLLDLPGGVEFWNFCSESREVSFFLNGDFGASFRGSIKCALSILPSVEVVEIWIPTDGDLSNGCSLDSRYALVNGKWECLQ